MSLGNCSYSKKEHALMDAVGIERGAIRDALYPDAMYRVMVNIAFGLLAREEMSPKATIIQNIYRCSKAIESGHPFRKTPEFEDLIEMPL